MFQLHPQLESDSHLVVALPLCQVRLLDDARYPWLLLVPQRPDVAQVLDLDEADQQTLWDEIRQVTRLLNQLWRPARVNLGISGIVVPQLHVHLIARFENDEAWPRPVWNVGSPQTHPPDLLCTRLDALRTLLRS
jgi:diadenosine tetraphosphate (Ap4A) HIT family hydrolase